MKNTFGTEDRANNLRIRLYAKKKSIKWAASRLQVSREWLSKVLNGTEKSEGLLDKLEDLLEDKSNYALAA